MTGRARTPLALSAVVVAIAAAAVVLRFVGLLDQIPREDEWHALARVSQDGFRAIASTFGVVDHGIPWTLYLEGVDRLVGLDERWFFLPGAFASLAFAILLPWISRRWIGDAAAAIWGALLGILPSLVSYSRTARPYGATCLLAPLSVVAWLRFRDGGDRRWAIAYVAVTAIVGWSLLPHLPFCLSVFLLPSTLRDLRDRERRGAVWAVATATAATLALLVLPPLWLGWKAIGFRVAAAARPALAELVLLPATLFGISPGPWHVGSVAIVSFAARALFRLGRDRSDPARQPVLALLVAVLVQVLAVFAVHPYGSDNRVVLARYLLPLAPVLGLLVALGIAGVAGTTEAPEAARKSKARPRVAAALFAVVAVFLVVDSPLLTLLERPDAFGDLRTEGMRPIGRRWRHPEWESIAISRRLPAAYRVFTPRSPETARLAVVEVPFSGLASLPYRRDQLVHRRRVIGGLVARDCDDAPLVGGGLTRPTIRRFRTMVDPFAVGDVVSRGAGWIVLHRDPWTEVDPRGIGREFPRIDFDACRARLESSYGAPVFDDGATAVYEVDAGPESTGGLVRQRR